ncbi:hypothetical protein SAMN05216570_3832 [Dyella sp. OK004]|uniref:hypothetical protein n=1 Tax=Dyella sp. OK004 TaxID=1855292 RepID=UPI0008EB2104|nr:hypothetical protein [Dyella sp. OK004]SFS18850.1 hypothetical protein SAMN05216570_3832 [Dyella sp. OK004]
MNVIRHISLAFRGAPAFALSLALGVAAMSPAHADAPLAQAADQYAQMCATQGTSIPAPHGESDLKDNPKLGEYCKCFGEKFAKRALASMNDKAAPSLEQTVSEEQAMRNGCRKQVGLPLLKF